MKKRISKFFLLLTVLLVMGACNKEELMTVYQEAELTVYTTIYPIEFIVETIGEEIVDVQSIYPPGVDAHTFEPTSKDMTKIARSDLFIYFGQSMEGFVHAAEDALAKEAVRLVALEENEQLFELNGLTEISEEKEEAIGDHEGEDGHDHGDHNPHVWIDPLRMMVMTDLITEQLIAAAPEHEERFLENSTDLKVRLQKLDEQFEERMALKDKKYMIVPHAAFTYWEERYGIEQIPINGLSTTEEPSQKLLTSIIEKAESLGIDYVFYEQNTPDKLIEIIREHIGAESYAIHNLSVLTEEDLENEEDYFSLMERNLQILDDLFE